MEVNTAKQKRYKGVAKRLEFNIRLDKDVKELRATLTNHASTINMLLLGQTMLALPTVRRRRKLTACAAVILSRVRK